MYQQIVIAGGGQAAVQTVDTLRRRGFTGALTLVGDEPWLPYQRPPLSKKYLAGALERERLLIPSGAVLRRPPGHRTPRPHGGRHRPAGAARASG